MTENECKAEIEKLLKPHGMSYSTPAGQLGYGLAFRSATKSVIIPHIHDKDSTQREVIVRKLRQQLAK